MVGEIDHVKWLVNVGPDTDDVRDTASARHRHRSPHDVETPWRNASAANFISKAGAGWAKNCVDAKSFAVNTSRSMPIHFTTQPGRVPVAAQSPGPIATERNEELTDAIVPVVARVPSYRMSTVAESTSA